MVTAFFESWIWCTGDQPKQTFPRSLVSRFELNVGLMEAMHCGVVYLAPQSFPLVILTAVALESIPLFNHSTNVRNSPFLEDHVEELLLSATRGYLGEIYCVSDHPGHDRSYVIDAAKITAELGWQPRLSFEQGLEPTVGWYLEQLDWCQQVRNPAGYGGERTDTQAPAPEAG